MKLNKINLAAEVFTQVFLNGYGVFDGGRMPGFISKVDHNFLTVVCTDPHDANVRVTFKIHRGGGAWEGNGECEIDVFGWRLWRHEKVEEEIASQLAGTSKWNHPMQEEPEKPVDRPS